MKPVKETPIADNPYQSPSSPPEMSKWTKVFDSLSRPFILILGILFLCFFLMFSAATYVPESQMVGYVSQVVFLILTIGCFGIWAVMGSRGKAND